MALLITVYLALVNTSNSWMTSFIPKGAFTAIDIWLLFCKTMSFGAMAEYGFLLHCSKKQHSKKIQCLTTNDTKCKRPRKPYFPRDSDEFCRYIDLRALVFSIFSFVCYSVCYFGYYYARYVNHDATKSLNNSRFNAIQLSETQ